MYVWSRVDSVIAITSVIARQVARTDHLLQGLKHCICGGCPVPDVAYAAADRNQRFPNFFCCLGTILQYKRKISWPQIYLETAEVAKSSFLRASQNFQLPERNSGSKDCKQLIGLEPH